MSALFKSDIKLRGDLAITRRDACTGAILNFWERKNVITYGGMDILVKLMAPNSAFGSAIQSESQIRSMRFGTNNTQPQRTDTTLANEAFAAGSPVRVELADGQRIVGAAGTVEYVATLSAAMGNDVVYREAGLFTRGTDNSPILTSNAILFARQVFPDQPKTSAVELEFRWRTTITV